MRTWNDAFQAGQHSSMEATSWLTPEGAEQPFVDDFPSIQHSPSFLGQHGLSSLGVPDESIFGILMAPPPRWPPGRLWPWPLSLMEAKLPPKRAKYAKALKALEDLLKKKKKSIFDFVAWANDLIHKWLPQARSNWRKIMTAKQGTTAPVQAAEIKMKCFGDGDPSKPNPRADVLHTAMASAMGWAVAAASSQGGAAAGRAGVDLAWVLEELLSCVRTVSSIPDAMRDIVKKNTPEGEEPSKGATKAINGLEKAVKDSVRWAK